MSDPMLVLTAFLNATFSEIEIKVIQDNAIVHRSKPVLKAPPCFSSTTTPINNLARAIEANFSRRNQRCCVENVVDDAGRAGKMAEASRWESFPKTTVRKLPHISSRWDHETWTRRFEEILSDDDEDKREDADEREQDDPSIQVPRAPQRRASFTCAEKRGMRLPERKPSFEEVLPTSLQRAVTH